MSQQSQRIDLRFGGVAVEVSLQKTSGKPREAKHDVRRMIGDLPAEEARAKALREWNAAHSGLAVASEQRSEARGALREWAEEHGPLALKGAAEEGLHDLPSEPADPFADLPPERVEQGLYLPRDETDVAQDFTQDGEWVDLTAQLAEIDKRTRIDGMEVVATIDSTSVPRHRVRDSYWIGLAPDADGSPKVLALLWTALRKTRRAAVVKWTKRTNQALGIIVASGSVKPLGPMTVAHGASLALLEIEWSQNMREPGPRATQPLTVSCSVREEAAALALVEALAEPASFLDSVRDERTAKRAELLEAARAGRVEEFVPPAAPERAGSDLADALAGGGK